MRCSSGCYANANTTQSNCQQNGASNCSNTQGGSFVACDYYSKVTCSSSAGGTTCSTTGAGPLFRGVSGASFCQSFEVNLCYLQSGLMSSLVFIGFEKTFMQKNMGQTVNLPHIINQQCQRLMYFTLLYPTKYMHIRRARHRLCRNPYQYAKHRRRRLCHSYQNPQPLSNQGISSHQQEHLPL